MIEVKNANINDLGQDGILKLYGIIIDAYRLTEEEVWGPNYIRISLDEFIACIQREEILVAFLNGEIVGGIRYFNLRDNTWTFSLLGADFNHAGKGIGKALIDKVESLVQKEDGDKIHIEILRATEIPVTSKIILGNWYERLGYAFVKTIEVNEVYNDPAKWSRLANPSVFDCYLKSLH